MADGAALPEGQRRRAADEQIRLLADDVTALKEKQATLEAQIAENTEVTKRVEQNTKGVVDAFNAAVGGLRVLEFLARLAKWASYILAGATALWALVKYGDLPRPK